MVLVDNRLCECIRFIVFKFECSIAAVDLFRSEYILTEFGSDFRRKAIVNSFLRVVEVSDYVNAVLVPELTVLLIMENMRIVYEDGTRHFKAKCPTGRTAA